MIAFVGSVFSPYYAWARRRQGDARARPEAHCALNVSLYRRAPRATRYQRLWAMTERGSGDLQRTPESLQIGPSRLAWAADGLRLDVDEWTMPWPRKLRGRIHVQPQVQTGRIVDLDTAGRHQWQPISPVARVELDFAQPGLRWQGEAYLDSNLGSRPLERDFREWHWSRTALPGQRCEVLYDLVPTRAPSHALALAIDADGRIKARPAPPACPLPDTAWGLRRRSLAPAGAGPALLATLESGPFYARSLLHRPGAAEPLTTVHESLSLERFTRPVVQAMLPFRMPRWAA